MNRAYRKRFAMLWLAVAVVGVMLAILVAISLRIADRTNNHLVRHKAFSVVTGMRALMMNRWMRGAQIESKSLKMLITSGVFHIGILGPDLRYRAATNPAMVGKITPFRAAIRAIEKRKTAWVNTEWQGKRARVFAFVRGGRHMMHRTFVLEVVVSAQWPVWLRSWIGLMVGTSVLTLLLLVFFARWLQRQTLRAEELYQQAQRNRELQRLGEMSAMVAHQLRNPLAGIKGNLQLGMERLNSGRTEAGMQDLKAALQEIGNIEVLVRDLLAFTRDLKPRLQPVDLGTFMREIANITMEGQVEVQVPEGFNCDLDPGLFRQAMINLVHNAVQSGGTRIKISAGPQGDNCVIRVEDNGPGIDERVRSKLFEPFVSGKAKGTGLGLALVERVVKAHDGSITADKSTDLGGACFSIVLPKVNS